MTRKQNTGRDVAVLFGGIAAGIVGSRLLPPLIAAASGFGRARAGRDPFEQLIEDHRQIVSVLEQMAMAHADSTLRRSRLFLMLKRKLAKHMLAEEDVVYPVLHSQPEHAAQSKHLYDEHADMKILLFELEVALKAGVNWSGTVSSLRDSVRRHVDEVEHTVFPQLRGTIGENRLPRVSGQIRREEALIL